MIGTYKKFYLDVLFNFESSESWKIAKIKTNFIPHFSYFHKYNAKFFSLGPTIIAYYLCLLYMLSLKKIVWRISLYVKSNNFFRLQKNLVYTNVSQSLHVLVDNAAKYRNTFIWDSSSYACSTSMFFISFLLTIYQNKFTYK